MLGEEVGGGECMRVSREFQMKCNFLHFIFLKLKHFNHSTIRDIQFQGRTLFPQKFEPNLQGLGITETLCRYFFGTHFAT